MRKKNGSLEKSAFGLSFPDKLQNICFDKCTVHHKYSSGGMHLASFCQKIAGFTKMLKCAIATDAHTKLKKKIESNINWNTLRLARLNVRIIRMELLLNRTICIRSIRISHAVPKKVTMSGKFASNVSYAQIRMNGKFVRWKTRNDASKANNGKFHKHILRIRFFFFFAVFSIETIIILSTVHNQESIGRSIYRTVEHKHNLNIS